MKTEIIKLIDGRDDVTLTTYVLEDSPELLNGGRRPAVLICPGGAYLGCSDREAEPMAMAFLRMGYNAFVLRYSVAYDGMKPFDDTDFLHMPVNPNKVYPQQMREIGLAFKCIHENAADWFVDDERIAICGFSAGAHNCAMYATHWSKPVIADFVGIDKKYLKPAACILGYPLTDYVLMYEAAKKIPDFGFFGVSNRLAVGEDWENIKTLTDLSPARLVDEDVPATFIWATSKDEIVPVEQSTVYATALAGKGIPFELHVYQDGPHGLSLADQSTYRNNYSVDYRDKDAAGWINLCQTWLEKYLGIYK